MTRGECQGDMDTWLMDGKYWGHDIHNDLRVNWDGKRATYSAAPPLSDREVLELVRGKAERLRRLAEELHEWAWRYTEQPR